MNAREIQRVFHSRTPSAGGRGGGLYQWYADMIGAGIVQVEVAPYETPTYPFRNRPSEGGETLAHKELIYWAERTFPTERKDGDRRSNRDMLGYGTSDFTTTDRVVECGNTPPVKLKATEDRWRGIEMITETITLKVEPDLRTTLTAYADREGLTLSEAGRKLLREQLKKPVPLQDLNDAGYLDGRRDGLRAFHEALAGMLNKFKEGK